MNALRSRTRTRWRYLLHGVLPVLAAAAIYVLFRSPRLRAFSWLDAWGLGDLVAVARVWARPAAEHLPQWLLFSAPDALWVYALTACLAIVWRGERTARRWWLCAGIALAAGGELGQWIGLVPGVFDPADLLLSLAAWGAAIVLNPSGASDEPGRCASFRNDSAVRGVESFPFREHHA